jgi:4'-phosphopantetheinyl transferase
MRASSKEPMIPDQKSHAAISNDLNGGPSGEMRKVSHVALRNMRRPNLTMTNIRVGESITSLDFWYVDLDAAADDLLCIKRWLSTDELARAQRFHFDRDRTRYIAGRAALRCVLADRLGCSPVAIRFSYGKNGKPILEGDAGCIQFNLAHSGGDAVIAVADGAVVGVDIELLRPIADVKSLAQLVFSNIERRELELARDPVSAFLNGWTRKEAYVKALGLGLTAPLQEISVSLSGRAALFSAGLRDQSVSNWHLLNLPHARAVVALALGPRHCEDGVKRNYPQPANPRKDSRDSELSNMGIRDGSAARAAHRAAVLRMRNGHSR